MIHNHPYHLYFQPRPNPFGTSDAHHAHETVCCILVNPLNKERNKHVDHWRSYFGFDTFHNSRETMDTMDHGKRQLEDERMGFAHLQLQALSSLAAIPYFEFPKYQRCRRLFSVIERCHRGALAHSFDWWRFHVRASKATAESLDSSSDSSTSDVTILAVVDLHVF